MNSDLLESGDGRRRSRARATQGRPPPDGAVFPTLYEGIDRRDAASREGLVRRVWREYEEMPGMSLTAEQAARLLGLRHDITARVLEALVLDGVLRRTARGQYILSRQVA